MVLTSFSNLDGTTNDIDYVALVLDELSNMYHHYPRLLLEGLFVIKFLDPRQALLIGYVGRQDRLI